MVLVALRKLKREMAPDRASTGIEGLAAAPQGNIANMGSFGGANTLKRGRCQLH